MLSPSRDRARLIAVLAALVAGALLLGVGIAGLLGSGGSTSSSPAVAQLLTPSAAAPALPDAAVVPSTASGAAQDPSPARERLDAKRFAANDRAHVRASWVAGYYPIYERAAKAYGVNWLLLASIHKQETAFSTSRGIFAGLNFANCCAGPMQFNVTNGAKPSRDSTWARYKDAFAAAPRPVAYNHATAQHPSVYDDFDSIMAAAKLLRDSGAGADLDVSAWTAAYDYYGHDATGIAYANQVLARAIGWGRGQFCINCEVDGEMLARVDGAWGAPVRAASAPKPAAKKKPAEAHSARKR